MAEPTFAIFSDSKLPGWAEGFATLLREGPAARVNIAGSLDEAFDGDSDVLVLDLGLRRDEKLPPQRIASLGRRRIIAMAPGADWLCAQLDDIEFKGSNVTGDLPMLVVDSVLLGKRGADEPMRPFDEIQDAPSAEWTPETPRACTWRSRKPVRANASKPTYWMRFGRFAASATCRLRIFSSASMELHVSD